VCKVARKCKSTSREWRVQRESREQRVHEGTRLCKDRPRSLDSASVKWNQKVDKRDNKGSLQNLATKAP
jgi:hypothetical protein